MLFNSIRFLIFFSIVVMLYFLIPAKRRWILLLIASYYFYMSWNAKYAILMIISTIVSYFTARIMYKLSEKKKRKKYLYLSLIINLGLLFIFKYFNFFSNSFRKLFELFSIGFNTPYLNVLLPIGISFYTFQIVGYLIDVYSNKIKPEKHLGIFAVYVSFFPQLIAGPIERSKNLIPQFYKKFDFEYDRLVLGLKIILWGFFLKIVVADRLAIAVNNVYNNPMNYTGLPLIIATFFFGFQIYGDFAGYSLIAIGSAKIMGYNLMSNFKRPYFSKSISEFWRRWHISLSSWFRDYVYFPLGGNRVSLLRLYFNIMVVFLVSGLWHGANWTFIVWGSIHGLFFVFALITKQTREKIWKKIKLTKFPKFHSFLQIISIFILVQIAWIFFRANSLSDGIYILINLFKINFVYPQIGLEIHQMIFAFILIAFVIIVEFFQERMSIMKFLSTKHIVIRWAIYLFLLIMILLFGVFKEAQFIYFQF